MAKPIKVSIFNNDYLLKSDEDEDHVSRIAAYVNEKIDEICSSSEGLSEKKIAILAALNIAGEYFQMLKEREELVTDIGRRSQNLIQSIDSSL